MPTLLIATTNQNKLREYAGIFAGLPFDLRSLRDVGIDDDVEETGATFAENAQLKAEFYAARSGLLALADDSGLQVAALGGEPGVFSHRYAGPGVYARFSTDGTIDARVLRGGYDLVYRRNYDASADYTYADEPADPFVNGYRIVAACVAP